MRGIALAVGFCLAAVAGLAKADPLTLVETATLATTPVGTGGFSTTLSIDQFNVADATLTGVSVRFEGNVGGTIRIVRGFNAPIASPVSFTTRLGSDFSLTVAPGNVIALADVVSNDFTVSLNVLASRTSGQLAGAAAITTAIAPSLFNLFQGPGSISLALGILRDNFTNDTLNRATETYNNSASAAVEVTYTYTLPPVVTTVPAPMSAGHLGVGIVGLVALRRAGRKEGDARRG